MPINSFFVTALLAVVTLPAPVLAGQVRGQETNYTSPGGVTEQCIARAIHGILLNSPGHRYNSSVDGTRASGWGKGQNFDFQKTAPYLALRR